MLPLYRKLLRYSFGISNNNTKQIVLQDVRHLFRDKLKNVMFVARVVLFTTCCNVLIFGVVESIESLLTVIVDSRIWGVDSRIWGAHFGM